MGERQKSKNVSFKRSRDPGSDNPICGKRFANPRTVSTEYDAVAKFPNL